MMKLILVASVVFAAQFANAQTGFVDLNPGQTLPIGGVNVRCGGVPASNGPSRCQVHIYSNSIVKSYIAGLPVKTCNGFSAGKQFANCRAYCLSQYAEEPTIINDPGNP